VNYEPKPHISQAVQHARFVVSMAGLVLGVCLFLQVVVWAAVHYTDVRTEDLRQAAQPAEQPLSVIKTEEPESNEFDDGDLTAQEAGALLDDILAEREAEPEPVDANRVQSAGDLLLSRFSNLVQTVGIIAAVVFAFMMFQAMVIAGGAAIPGVDKAVSASSWALVVSMLCLPLGSILPSIPFGGVFLSYEQLINASGAYRNNLSGAPGFLGFYGWHVVMPFAVLATLFMVILRFRAGVEAGVIVTSVSQLDEKLEQEIRSMKLGQLSAPRSVGALNAAIGDSNPAPAPMSLSDTAEDLAATGTDGGGKRRPI
jgi:hypothetical protein